MVKTFDLIVIGAGSGLDVAAAAAGRKLKVAIIDKGPMGGTCLNRGCIPSKVVIHSSDVVDTIFRSNEFGITSNISKINFKYVTDRANKEVDHDAKMIENGVLHNKYETLYKGTAQFVGPYTIKVNNEIIKSKKIVIAAGARPFIPPIKGLDKVPYMTSTEALRQTKLPKSMIIIGGGYIGVELGHFYASLGTKVTIVQRGPLLIPREDKDVAHLFTELWEKKYDLLLNSDATEFKKLGKNIQVTVKQNKSSRTIMAEKVLIATGVQPNTNLLDLPKTGVKINKKGFIQVNKYLETNVKNIWAFGDIAGVYMFKHSANLESEYVINNMFTKKKSVDYDPMPHAIFTNPQIAGVGLTEQECIEKKKKYVVGKYEYKNTGMGLALNEKHGFAKIIIDKKSRIILGCHIIGPQASTLLHQVVVAMKLNPKKALWALQNTVIVHPALNEVISRAAYQL